MYTVSWFIMLYDVIYVYTTFYMMYIMNTTCTMFHQTSIVTGHTIYKERHNYTYDINGTPFATHDVFFRSTFFLLYGSTPYSLFHVRIFIQDFMDWTTLVTLAAHENPPLMSSQSPLKIKQVAPKRKGLFPPFATIFQNKHVCFRVCNIYVCIYIYIHLYIYKKL